MKRCGLLAQVYRIIRTCLLGGCCFLLVERGLHLVVFLGTCPAAVVVHPIPFNPTGVRTSQEGAGDEGRRLNCLSTCHHSQLDAAASLGEWTPSTYCLDECCTPFSEKHTNLTHKHQPRHGSWRCSHSTGSLCSCWGTQRCTYHSRLARTSGRPPAPQS